MCSMSMADEAELLQRARNGSESAFAELFGSQRAHLFRHSYRMLGSGPEADDAVQDALVRAWQRLETFDGRGSFQGWLYRIATNICLDRLRGRRSKSHPVQYGPASAIGRAMESGGADVEWVQPLGEASADPEESAIGAEAISLAFVVALQQLPARQRAALLLHDVMGFEPDEVASVLDATPSAVNSLLHRARQTMQATPTPDLADPNDPEVRALLERYIRAWRLADIAEFVETVSDDVRMSMPPLRNWYLGSADVASFIRNAIFDQTGGRGVLMLDGIVNGQTAVATYMPTSSAGEWAVSGLQVLDVDNESKLVVSITSFLDPAIAQACGFPATVDHQAS